jgi:light-regulated signal transduction histidine kinase (bacteriophytochrome)
MNNKLDRQSKAIAESENERLIIEKQELEIANQKLEEFVSIVTHDLQAPLRSLTMFAELLAKDYQGELDEVGAKYIKHITDSGVRMQALIQDLLTYSRAGKSQQTWVFVDLNNILEKVTQDLQAAIIETQAVIVVDDLPTIFVNPTEIAQVFQNLIDNAIKFCSEQQPWIEVKATKQENWLFSVKDNGIGIEPEFQAQIFQVLQRLHPPETYPGTGIGLAICEKIVRRYDGKIWVESEPNKGSTFYFTLPINLVPHPHSLTTK